MAQIRDMTKGSPARHIIAFAAPMLLGNVFQQMYSIVDAAVLGQVEGSTALAAVGSAGWLDWLVLGFVIGLTQGFSILISQRFGSGDHAGMRKAAATSIFIAVGIMALVTALSLSLCKPVLRLMNTPDECMPLAYTYASIIFMGIPVTMSYNLFAGMLRALGNTRVPLIAMTVAALANIALDFVLIVHLRLGVAGAAVGTVICQIGAALICLATVLRTPQLKLGRKDMRFDRDTAKALIRLGLPIAGQNTVTSVGGVILQSIVNGFGIVIMAGFSAAAKLLGLLEMAGISIGSAMHTYAGQNMGAQQYGRIREGVKKALIVAISVALICGAVGLVFGRQMLSLFVDQRAENAGAVVEAAYRYLRIVCFMLFTLYSLFIFRSSLQGMGDALFPVISSFMQVFVRSVVTYFLARWIGEYGLYIGDTLAWMTAGIFLMIIYLRRIGRIDPRATAE